jgi:hypothetical protein
MWARAVVTLTDKEELEIERMVAKDMGADTDRGGAPVGMYSGTTRRQFTSKELRVSASNGSVSPTAPTGEVYKSGKSTFYR